MKFRLGAFAVLLASGLIACLLFFPAAIQKKTQDLPQAADPSKATPPQTQERNRPDYRAEWSALLDEAAVTPPELLRDQLLALRATWAQRDLTETANEIEALLESGDDYDTGLPVVVGPNGLLDAWPTFRVFLLDALGIADPNRAVEIARKVMQGTRSGDEFAIALRSLTREGPWRAQDAELLQHFDRMLRNESWWQDQGFAEAFDMPRVLGSEEAATTLAYWSGNPALRSQALHEFAAEHPAQMLAVLQSGPPLPPAEAAMLLSRADPSDPAQAETIDAFLRNPETDPQSATTFLSLFPLRSASTGHRLYGKAPAPFSNQSVRDGDLAALALVDTWISDPTMQPKRAELFKLREKLVEWTEPGE